MFHFSCPKFQENMEDTMICCQGLFVASIEACLLPQIKTLAYKVIRHFFVDYFQKITTLAYICCVNFDHLLAKCYQTEYLYVPKANDLKSISNLHHHTHKVDGMFGKKASCTLVFKDQCDYHAFFWHASYGYTGTMNDINIFNLVPLFD
ncbi:hypothetical protein ACHAXS_006242 [Conticribra weissflogii]